MPPCPPRSATARAAVVTLAIVGFAGCAGNVVRPPAYAHMAVQNLTAYAWHIVLTPDAGGAAQVLRIEPRASPSIDVPAGHYHVVQSIASPEAGGTPARRFEADFEPGQTYRWPLMTLLSP